MTPEEIVEFLDLIKAENPNQIIVLEMKKGTVDTRIGDALIYDDPHGWVVIDSE